MNRQKKSRRRLKKSFILFLVAAAALVAVLVYMLIAAGKDKDDDSMVNRPDLPAIAADAGDPGQDTNGPHASPSSSPSPSPSFSPSPSPKPVDVPAELMLVNGQNLLDEGYAPMELVNLYEDKSRPMGLSRSDITLGKTAYDAAYQMFADAAAADVKGYIITSGYRTPQEQQTVYDETPEVANQPGASEHQTGLAFDVTAFTENGSFGDTEQFAWLRDNCARYGFILRYPQGKEEITGVPYEPWHYRYVGLPYSTEIMEAGLTLEEYLEENF